MHRRVQPCECERAGTGTACDVQRIRALRRADRALLPISRSCLCFLRCSHRFISKMFLRGDSVILVLRNPV